MWCHVRLQRKSRVEKDVRRTDRGVPFYADSRNPNVAMLRRILLTYSIYNFDLSYCQARDILRHQSSFSVDEARFAAGTVHGPRFLVVPELFSADGSSSPV